MSSHGLHRFSDYYTKASIQALVEKWGINIFRTTLYVGEGGYATDAKSLDLLHKIVTWCEELGIYALIDWHILTPGDPNAWLAPTTSIKAVLSDDEGMGQKAYRNPACIIPVYTENVH